MPPMMLVVVGASVIIALIVVLFMSKRVSLSSEEEIREGKYPQGYFLGIGLAVCIALGVLAGLAMGSVPLGTAIGIGFGLMIGQSLEKKLNGDIGPLTESEKRERLNRKGLGLIAMYVLVLVTAICAYLQFTR